MSTIIYIDNSTNDTLSRYNSLRFLLDLNNNVIQESWFLKEPIEDQSDDIYFEVSPKYAHRPDLIALDLYGNMRLYWIIAYKHNMIDPVAEMYSGLKLRLPSSIYLTKILNDNL